MIEIVGTALNQWDTGRVVHITGIEAEYAHFANKGDSKAVIMGVVDIEAKIPDYLLQTGKQLCVYAVKDGITLESKTFSVRNRERPENYVYEDDQRNYIYELITSAENAIEGAIQAVEEANLALENANTAAGKVNAATENAVKSAASASEAAKNANEAAAKAAHTAKSLMVVGGAEGANIALDDAINQYLVGLRIFGKSTQAGTPTPDAPVDIVSVGAGGSITVNVAGVHEANSMTIATPNGLPGIPVTSGGNYTDANGQQWICDEIDFGRGVYVRRIQTITFYGTEDWYINNVSTTPSNINRYFVANVIPNALVGGPVFGLLCNVADWAGVSASASFSKDGSVQGYSFTQYLGWIGFAVSAKDYPDVASFRAKLTELASAGTPVKICVANRVEQTETPLSAEELAAHASLHTYKNSTTVSNDAGAWMDLEYVMDAKKYIDRLLGGGASATIHEATVE